MKGEGNNFKLKPEIARQPVRHAVPTLTAWTIGACLQVLSCGPVFSTAEIDEAKLPPSATIQVDFNRDIKPILETSCLRCHGPEKPKGGFRLDNRESALKGGDNGRDILPGDGAKSPLIHYVAYLVDDLEMPPIGKGDQLTAQQVGLLRAWIDQGVAWDTVPPTNSSTFSISPIFGWTAVNGDEHKFREHYWQKEGFNGGAENFELFEQAGPDTKLLLAGHALLDDYKIALSLDRNELGFIHTGWDQYRKYYDGHGGYLSTMSPPSPPPLAGDLYLDIGKAWVDFGLTLPHWPRMVLGYEYDYRQGTEATTSWGNYDDGTLQRNIAPTSKNIDEGVHIIKFDFDAEVRGVTVEDRFRGEFYQLNTQYTNQAARGPVSQNASQETSYFQGANAIRLEKKFNNWLLGSAGYFYSRLNADGNFTDTATYANTPYVGTVPQITLERDAHVFNLNGLIGPFAGLTFTLGAQSEWTREHGFGSGDLHRIPFTSSAPLYLAITNTALSSDHDENSVSETFAVRYTKIPFTLLFAEARLQQKRIGQTDSDIQPSDSYLDNINFTSQLTDLRFGFTTSPWRKVSLSAHYRRYENDSQYLNNLPPQPVGGYPGFIKGLDILTDEVEAKLVLRPVTWFKTTLSYQYLNTDSWTDTNPALGSAPAGTDSPGGNILAGQSDAQIYSISMTLTPRPRLYLDATFSYQTSSTITANNNVPTIAPYRGNIYSVIASGTYVLNQTTDLFASYAFSEADYAQDNFVAGVPMGIEYRQQSVQIGLVHRLGKNVSAQLRYGFYKYDEPSSGEADNYYANSIFGMMTLRFP